jgi:hypothetical protein
MITYCDRCGKEFDKWNYKGEELIGVAEFVYDHGKQYLDCQKDLCKSCYDELEKWWNSETAAEDDEWIDFETAVENANTKHKNVDFKVGDKVRIITERINGCKFFPLGTIGVITYIEDSRSLPYTVWSEELNASWCYPGEALELVDTKPVKKHKDVDFRIGDKVRTLVETVEGDKLFPVGTIGVITDIDNDELPYRVESEEFNDCWYYPEYALELVDEDELCK